MKLQRREKILVGASGGLVVLIGLYFLFIAGDSRSVEQLLGEQSDRATKMEAAKKVLAAAERDKKRLADWQQRALPPDPLLARTLYQNWLRSLISRVNFHNYTLVDNVVALKRDQFSRISIDVRAKAKLGDVIQFMYEFYSAGYLHQIRKIDMKPMQSSTDLDLSLTIEALSLPTAVNKDRLSQVAGKELALAKLSDYRTPITTRDLFASYVKPVPHDDRPPPGPPKPAAVDPADFAVVTAFTEVDGAPSVWIHDNMGAKTWKLGVGEGFAVGTVKGTVESIRPDGAVVVQMGSRRRMLRMGDNLHGGVDIPSDPTKRADQRDNSVRSATVRNN